MSAFTQAVFYNVVSSVLALVGMVTGLLLAASLPSVTPWLFAGTAGAFLYVALVDMVPELSSGHAHPISRDHQREPRGLALALQVGRLLMLTMVAQVLGMATGMGIMLVIALYEHQVKEALGGAGHH